MMKKYARVVEGVVVEIILPAAYDMDSPEGVEPGWHKGDDIPIDRRFHPDFLATLIDVSDGEDVAVGYRYQDGIFTP